MEKLLFEFGNSKKYPILEGRIKAHKEELKKTLTDAQYRQLQNLQTDTESYWGENSYENFICGIRFALTLMSMVYNSNINHDG